MEEKREEGGGEIIFRVYVRADCTFLESRRVHSFPPVQNQSWARYFETGNLCRVGPTNGWK
jgi:hypothetical protein